MKKKLQVFVSSTYLDMPAERQAAVEAILEAGHIPAGMELFASGDESQWETIKTWIDDSDVFLLILGGRYGSLEQKSGKSYIELEYDYAAKKDKPFFAAVISEEFLNSKIKDKGIAATESANSHLLSLFRTKVTSKMCRFFKDTKDLKLIVYQSLSRIERNENLAGWIHGTEVVNPKETFEEIKRLQGENAALRTEIAELRRLVALQPNQLICILAQLSSDEKELLLAAKKYHGTISAEFSEARNSVRVGKRQFIQSEEHREAARWKSALKELLSYSLIEGPYTEYIPGFDGEISERYYQLTKSGYDGADEIEAFEKKEIEQNLIED